MHSSSKDLVLTNDNTTDSSNTDNNTAIVPYNQSTYVVRVPKDQIFRVPPPENAKIIEEHQNKAKANSKSSCCCFFLCRLFLVLLVLASLCLVGILIIYFIAKPSAPSFNVDTVTLFGASSKHPEFDFNVTAENVSPLMDFLYQTDGKLELDHQGQKIAVGDPPVFKIKRKDIVNMKLTVQSTRTRMPKELSSTTKNVTVVPLSLSGEFPLKLGLGVIRMRRMDMKVNCDVKVKKSAKELKVVSQSCEAKFER